jgi:hypothetical protein
MAVDEPDGGRSVVNGRRARLRFDPTWRVALHFRQRPLHTGRLRTPTHHGRPWARTSVSTDRSSLGWAAFQRAVRA